MRKAHYREHLYRFRSHPEENTYAHTKDSMGKVFISVIPFVTLEGVGELFLHAMPSGLIFPLGFLLFWSFYYAIFRPYSLESHLKTDTLSFGAVISFITVTLLTLLKNGIQFITKLGDSFFQPGVTRESKIRLVHPSIPKEQPELPRDVVNSLAILGLGIETRDWNTIHHRYRELAKRYHPDLNSEITLHGRRFITYDAAYRKLESVKLEYFVLKNV